MGSRNYIGHLGDGNVVTFSYCHTGSYMDANGQTLLDYFNDEEKAKALAHTGGMHSISDGEVDAYDDRDCPKTEMSLESFLAIDANDIESLFLYIHNFWCVKSFHIESDKLEKLETVLENMEQEQEQSEQGKRESMLEMMRIYQSETLAFFTGDKILDVEVICDMCREVQGVILTLAS